VIRKVLHILRGSAFYGGPEIYVLNLFQSLDLEVNGIQLAVLAKDIQEKVPICREAEKRGLPFHFISARSKFRLHYVRKLKELIQSEKIDLVHTHEYKSDLFGLLVARTLGIPIVATAHGWTRNSVRAVAYERLEAYLLRGVDKVLVASRFMEKDLSNNGVPAGRIVRVANAIDVDRFSLKGVTPEEARATLHINGNGTLIGSFGRMSREKGHRFLLMALARIRDKINNVKLLLLGSGEEESNLHNLSRKLGLENVIQWVPSCLYDTMPFFFRALDLFVLPSLLENQPLVLLEAMAARVPVVATRVGGVEETIQSGREGVLVSPGNAESLAEAIDHAIRSGESSQWVEKAFSKVYTLFSLERFSRDITCVYEKLA